MVLEASELSSRTKDLLHLRDREESAVNRVQTRSRRCRGCASAETFLCDAVRSGLVGKCVGGRGDRLEVDRIARRAQLPHRGEQATARGAEVRGVEPHFCELEPAR